MASSSSSHYSNMIQFPRLPSMSDSWDTTGDKHLLPPRPHPLRDGRVLKQSKSTESLSQRKDRVEFLRRREWTRRVASGGDQPSSIPRRARTYSWEDIIAAADAAADSWDYNSAGYVRRPDTIDELDESDEPYVIYTATPRPPAPSTYTPHTPGATVLYSTSPSPSPSPTLSPLSTSSPVRDLSSPSSISTAGNAGAAVPYYSRKGWRGPHSRHSSLSSISEEDEGLARF
ncbi:hypothetical protein C8Q70DRAFT_933533 [Cubamyces menziesii]|nr:hypothetical protein C8Q70DRAFT_933533 [Cubamyces menziesii]